MTNAELLAKIKAEIERRKKEIHATLFNDEFDSLISFLSTLESEKPMQDGLEEEIHKYNKERFDEYFPEQDGDFISEVDFMTCLGRIARHFAQWGAEHAPLPEDTALFNKGVEEGKRLMMEEDWAREYAFNNAKEITPIMAEYVADVFSRKEHLDNISYGYCMEIADVFRRYAERAEHEQPEKPIQEGFSKEFDEYFLPKNSEQKGQWVFADIFSLARHFAQWGYLRAAEKYNEIEYNRQRAEEPVSDNLEEAAEKFARFYDQGTCDGIAQDCFIAGAKWDRQQMMKEAVEGEVRKDGTIGYFEFSNEQQFHSLLEQFQDCDKVRIVIVKEDEK